MIHVIATVRVQSGRRQDFLARFHQVVPLVREEQGCLEYGPTIDADSGIEAQQRAGEDVVVIIERWEGLDDLRAHLVADHMQTYREQVKDLVADVQLQILETA